MSFDKTFFCFCGICLMLLMGLWSCEEKDYPGIILNDPGADTTLLDTTYLVDGIPAAQGKVVVIEEFSGVQCVNCPQGAEAVEAIIANYPDEVVSLTLHAGDFSVPFSSSEEVFDIEETDDLNTFFEIIGYPAAVIDRTVFEGHDQEAIAGQLSSWEVFTEERLTLTTPVNLSIENTYDEETRKLKTRVEIVYTEAVEEEHKLSLFLAESGIIDPQLSENGIIQDYEHKHVVRDMLTAARGIVFFEGAKEEGRTIVREFSLTLDEAWNVEECEVVAFVHESLESKEVLQGAKKKVF